MCFPGRATQIHVAGSPLIRTLSREVEPKSLCLSGKVPMRAQASMAPQSPGRQAHVTDAMPGLPNWEATVP